MSWEVTARRKAGRVGDIEHAECGLWSDTRN